MAFRPTGPTEQRSPTSVDVPGYPEPFDPIEHGWDGQDQRRNITVGVMAAAAKWAKTNGAPRIGAVTAAMAAWDKAFPGYNPRANIERRLAEWAQREADSDHNPQPDTGRANPAPSAPVVRRRKSIAEIPHTAAQIAATREAARRRPEMPTPCVCGCGFSVMWTYALTETKGAVSLGDPWTSEAERAAHRREFSAALRRSFGNRAAVGTLQGF